MNRRLHELDSLRGLAALSVLACHLMITIPVLDETTTPEHAVWWQKLLILSPFHIFTAGHEAVVFFFVLSGFVLSLPYFSQKQPAPYHLYLAKRIIRLYPPYILAACSAMLLRQVLYHGDVPGVSNWFNQSWRVPVDWSIVKNHLLMLGSFRNCDYDPVLWSLVQEMRISLIFPLIALLVRYSEKTAFFIAFSFTIFCWYMLRLKFFGVISWQHDYFQTLQYIGSFVVGATLAKHRHALVRYFSGISRRKKVLLVFGGVLAYTNASWLPYYGSFGRPLISVVLQKETFNEWIVVLGVAIFIVASLSTRKISGFLKRRALQFFGEISYSIYLYHAVCIKAVVTLLHPFLPLWAILLIALITSLFTATASYYCVEVPSMNFGKWLSNRYDEAHPERRLRKAVA